MTMTILDLFGVTVTGWIDTLVSASMAGGAALLLVWCMLKLTSWLRRSAPISPRVRCWLWRLAYLKLLLALAAPWCQPIELALLPPVDRTHVELGSRGAISEGVEVDRARGTRDPAAVAATDPLLWARTLLLLLWLGGACAAAVRIARQLLHVRRLRRGARRIEEAAIDQQLVVLSGRIGLTRVPGVAISPEVRGPQVAGWRDPVILLSPQDLGSPGLPALLGHELAHIRRRDLLWTWLPTVARCLFFFHPVVWLAELGWRRDQEMAADELALGSTGADPARYARALVAATTRTAFGVGGIAAGGSFRFHEIKERILGLESYRRPCSRRRVVATGALLGVIALAVLPPWRLGRAAPRQPDLSPRRGATVVQKHFGRHKVKGCFLLADVKRGTLLTVGGKRCDLQLPPCSTFKLPHAMFGVDAGVLAGPETSFRWDHSKQHFKAWERDHTLRTAFRDSVLWFFQRVARGVGRERMRRFLDALKYGNRKMSSKLTRFWIDGSLKISAQQQLRLLVDLYRDRLPVSRRARRIARELMAQSRAPGLVFGGKTGTCMMDGKITTGWYIGHLKRSTTDYVFVTLIRAERDAWGPKAKKISRAILEGLELVAGQQSDHGRGGDLLIQAGRSRPAR
jgi:beta-lactamase class D/beta-lactamase regulating signal transducer with metallopeptidase domain